MIDCQRSTFIKNVWETVDTIKKNNAQQNINQNMKYIKKIIEKERNEVEIK